MNRFFLDGFMDNGISSFCAKGDVNVIFYERLGHCIVCLI